MLAKLKQIVMAPFKYGFEAVDTRPSGGAYRRVARQLTAVESNTPGEIALVVGKGKVTNMPVVEVIKAETPVEAVNATLKMVGSLRRSKARAINKVAKTIDRDLAKALASQKAAAKQAKAVASAEGNVAQGSPGTPTLTTVVSGPVVGEPALA